MPKAKDGDVKKKLSSNDKIKELELELSKTKVNKRTEAAVGQLKAKIARLKDAEVQKAVKGRGPGSGYSVRKTGDGTAVLVGFPSVGKSTLLNALTNAQSETGAYAFTTLTVVPGLLKHKSAKIQILDVPGIVKGAAAGTGRGKEVLQVMRNTDLVIFVLDVTHPEHIEALHKEVYDAGIRVNQRTPDIKIIKQGKGGIDIGATVKLTHLDEQTIINVLKEYGIINASIVFRENATVERLIDAIEANKVYVPAVTFLNKIDMASPKQIKAIEQLTTVDLKISAHNNINIDEAKQLIYDRLQIIRIYLKEWSKAADMDEPLIMRKGQTLKDVCQKLHKDFVAQFKYAKIWGPSAKFDAQVIRTLDHQIADKDIVEISIR